MHATMNASRCASVVQVLLVNLVTSTTLGLALAAEPAEPTLMDQPPRRPNKRLMGKLLLWRMFFVCHLVVVLVLGVFAWAQATGHSLGQSRAEAFNVLVGSQVSCRCRMCLYSVWRSSAQGQGNRVPVSSTCWRATQLVVLLGSHSRCGSPVCRQWLPAEGQQSQDVRGPAP